MEECRAEWISWELQDYYKRPIRKLLLSIPDIEDLVKEYKHPHCTKRSFEPKLDWIIKHILYLLFDESYTKIDDWYREPEWNILKHKENEFIKILDSIDDKVTEICKEDENY